MNRTILILAAVTVVLMPLTVISGALGMNVAGIPFADHPAAFGVVSLFLVIFGAAIALWMRRRKWL
jgi:zinc transporter